MSKPIATVGHNHTCPARTGKKKHVGGPIIDGQDFVTVNGVPVAVVGSKVTCQGPVDTIVSGSSSVKINGKAVARVGDKTAHGGVIVEGISGVTIK